MNNAMSLLVFELPGEGQNNVEIAPAQAGKIH